MNKEDKIIAYLNKRLIISETEKFEREIREDKDLFSEVLNYAVLKRIVENDDSILKKEKKYTKNRNAIIFIVTILSIIAVGTLCLMKHHTSSVDAEYLAYNDIPFRIDNYTKGDDETLFDSEIIKILSNKDTTQIEKVTNYLHNIKYDDNRYQQARFNLAYAFYLDKSYKSSIDILENISHIDSTEYLSEASEMLLLLNYFDSGKIEDLKSRSKSILQNNEHRFRKEVADLIRGIEKEN